MSKGNNTGTHEVPLFITFPRSGTWWVLACMQGYTQKTFSPTRHKRVVLVEEGNPLSTKMAGCQGTPVLWHTSHDLELEIDTSHKLGTAYLFRNPVDAIFSHCHSSPKDQRDQGQTRARLFVDHFNKWVVQKKARTIITYEDMVKDSEAVIRKLGDHLEIPFDEERVKMVAGIMTKENVNIVPGSHGPELMTNEYAEARTKFQKDYGSEIAKTIVNSTNEEALRKYMPSLFDYIENP